MYTCKGTHKCTCIHTYAYAHARIQKDTHCVHTCYGNDQITEPLFARCLLPSRQSASVRKTVVVDAVMVSLLIVHMFQVSPQSECMSDI